MKKVILTIMAAMFGIGIASAQDLESVTNLYNAAATALNAGNNEEALGTFENALSQAATLGEEGMEIVNDCKGIIPKILLSIGKDYANAKELDNAVDYFKKAIAKATEFENNEELVEEANSLIPQMLMGKANSLLNAKQFAEAAAAYKSITEVDPENGNAFLRMGQALAAGGDADGAIEALTAAMEKGQQAAASKQLANIYIKKASADLKAKKMKEALENAQLSAEYNDSPNAQKVIGTAASSLKQNKIAAEAFEKYLAMQPEAKDKVQTIYQLATALMNSGDNAKACGYFKQIKDDEKFGEAAKYQITTLKCN